MSNNGVYNDSKPVINNNSFRASAQPPVTNNSGIFSNAHKSQPNIVPYYNQQQPQQPNNYQNQQNMPNGIGPTLNTNSSYLNNSMVAPVVGDPVRDRYA